MGSADYAPLISILVVDGSADAAEALALVLRSNGYRVTVATSGEDALRAAEAAAPDVALLDCRLPDMDGWDVARRLRDLTAKKKPPLFVTITGCNREADRRRSAEAGIDLHLLKPVAPRELFAALDRHSQPIAPR